MPNVDAILSRLHPQATPEDLQAVSHALGEFSEQRDAQALGRISHRVRALRRATPEDAPAYGLLDALHHTLQGYLAALETIDRLEKLKREVAGVPAWRALMRGLWSAWQGNQEHPFCIEEHLGYWCVWSGLTLSPEAVSVELEDLYVRELVEWMRAADNRQREYALTRLGRQVYQALQPVSPPLPAR